MKKTILALTVTGLFSANALSAVITQNQDPSINEAVFAEIKMEPNWGDSKQVLYHDRGGNLHVKSPYDGTFQKHDSNGRPSGDPHDGSSIDLVPFRGQGVTIDEADKIASGVRANNQIISSHADKFEYKLSNLEYAGEASRDNIETNKHNIETNKRNIETNKRDIAQEALNRKEQVVDLNNKVKSLAELKTRTEWQSIADQYSFLEKKIADDSKTKIDKVKKHFNDKKTEVGNIAPSSDNSVELVGFYDDGVDLYYTGDSRDVITIDSSNAPKLFSAMNAYDESDIEEISKENVRDEVESSNSGVYASYRQGVKDGLYDKGESKTNDQVTLDNLKRSKQNKQGVKNNNDYIGIVDRASLDNTQGIKENKSEIKRVDTYAQENRGKIETNTTEISNNRKAISGNTAAIGKNTADIKDLRQDFENLSKDYYSFKEQTNGAIAGVAAMGQLAQPYGVGNFNVGVAVGDYSGQQAIAVGMGYRYNENVTVRAAAAANSGNNMEPILAASVNYEF